MNIDNYRLELRLESPVLVGSGEGWGSVIDTDVVFDDVGLPFIPARRVKGVLRESALELLEMFDISGISGYSKADLETAFGKSGSKEGGLFEINNLYLPDYHDVRDWCSWGIDNCPGTLSVDSVINCFTEVRSQTSLDQNGIAEDGSLRRSRVLKTGLLFSGAVRSCRENEAAVFLLALSCRNLKYIGTMRHKGLGRVNCGLYREAENITEKALQMLKKGVA
jgi:CRISPR/Cas system CSM-associated protein Csm3 (group 7 of RAMP superfamily)